jgi:2-hydroxychromene-2-carboxylate isomerase
VTGAGQSIDFYYGIGSRYSYLASTQLERLANETGCLVRWQPLYSADLFAARGLDPFKREPVSGQYDWAYRRRDAERWAAFYGVPYREPEDVRFDPRRLALACTAAAILGAVEPFSRHLFQAVFVDGTSPLGDEVCATLAREIGLDEHAFLAALGHPETAARLTSTVEEAAARGMFGVPSFVVGDEVYFGNDRLPLVRHALLQGKPIAART